MDATTQHTSSRLAAAVVLLSATACGGGQATTIPFDSTDPSSESSTTIVASTSTTTEPAPTAPASSTEVGPPGEPPAGTVGPTSAPGLEGEPLITEPAWRNATANLAGMDSDCGNLTTVEATPDTAGVIAGVALRGLWLLDGASEEWSPLGSGGGSATIANRPATILFDRERSDTFWEAGNYNSNGVYRTDDGGETFVQLGDIVHVDAVGVDMTDPLRQTMLASIHEQQDIRMSTDGGSSWSSLAENLPTDIGNSNVPHVVDSSTFLLGSWLTPTPGIHRSTDRGATWERVFDGYVLELGLPTVLPDGAILWVLHNGAGIIRSDDGGATWQQWSDVSLVSQISDVGDGRLAGVTADQVMVSDDTGANWSPVGPSTPFAPARFAYSRVNRTFYISHWDCGDVVLANAVAALSLLPG